jgi:hypothetical protein
VLGI